MKATICRPSGKGGVPPAGLDGFDQGAAIGEAVPPPASLAATRTRPIRRSYTRRRPPSRRAGEEALPVASTSSGAEERGASSEERRDLPASRGIAGAGDRAGVTEHHRARLLGGLGEHGVEAAAVEVPARPVGIDDEVVVIELGPVPGRDVAG